MSKKILIFSLVLVTNILTFSISKPTFAKNNGLRFWTIPQLIEMKADADAEIAILTGSCADRSCRDDIYNQRLNSEGKYKAIDSFSNMKLMVTSLYPAESKVKVMFHDEDPMFEKMFGIRRLSTLDELYLAWFAEPPVMYNSYYAVNGNYAGGIYHPLFSGTSATNGNSWLAPNIEVDLTIDDAESLYNLPYSIYFAMEADFSNSSGHHDYSDCMGSPVYENSMECRMVFDETGGFYFLPFLPGEDMPAPGSYTEWAETIDPKDNPNPVDTPEPSNNNPNSSGETNQAEDNNSIKNVQITKNISNNEKKDIMNAPDTGDLTFPTSLARKSDLPWWITALIVANLLLLIWLFVPIRKKSPKNHKKSLDKKDRLR